MPLSAIAEVILAPVFEAVAHVLGYLTGSVVVPVFSLGMLRVEPIPDKNPKAIFTLPGAPPPAEDSRIISVDATICFGLLFWVVVGVAVYFIKYRA